jgi:SOS response associated peptidase (SRAP)
LGILNGLSRVSWKLSRTVLRGGAAGNGGSLLDRKKGDKQPFAIARANDQLTVMAGLWEEWKSPAGETIKSCTVITTEAN